MKTITKTNRNKNHSNYYNRYGYLIYRFNQ